MISATLVSCEQHSPHLYTFWLKPERRLRFSAGQFTELTVPHAQPDNRGQTRKFSISSSPNNVHVGITISFPAATASSFKRALLHLQPGDGVLLTEPMGDFVLPKSPTPAVFIAGGVGITPVLSIIQWLAESASGREAHVVHAARNAASLLGNSLFQESAASYQPFLTHASAEWKGAVGKLSPAHLANLVTPTQRADHLFYISGPEHMVAQVGGHLHQQGVATQRIITDIFLGI